MCHAAYGAGSNTSEEHGRGPWAAPTNVLTGAAPTGQGTSGYNSAVVKVEKFAGDVVC